MLVVRPLGNPANWQQPDRWRFELL